MEVGGAWVWTSWRGVRIFGTDTGGLAERLKMYCGEDGCEDSLR